jgi:hypothetical protein
LARKLGHSDVEHVQVHSGSNITTQFTERVWLLAA